MHESKFYKIEKDNIRCLLCHHSCVTGPDQSGQCKVRKNFNGKLFSLAYGQPVAKNIDPVEKKPLFHFLPGTFTYSIGTFGCNFRCANCQNWSISQPDNYSLEYLEKKTEDSPESIVDSAVKSGCQSISYTYNEPTIFTEYALDIMKLARAKGLKNIWVSNGYMSDECLKEIIPYLDSINVDLKSFDNDFYIKNCSAKLDPILENLVTFVKNKIHLEITTLIIPGLSDDLTMLNSLSGFIARELSPDIPWHISRFFGDIAWKLKDTRMTNIKQIEKIYQIGKNQGLKYVYAGNAPTSNMENTYCPKCDKLIIERNGYQINRHNKGYKCQNCNEFLNIIS